MQERVIGCRRAIWHFVWFIVIGIVLSIVIGMWYGNSPEYCRDCNTGLGLCMFGFILSVPVTIWVIYVFRRVFIREQNGTTRRPSFTH